MRCTPFHALLVKTGGGLRPFVAPGAEMTDDIGYDTPPQPTKEGMLSPGFDAERGVQVVFDATPYSQSLLRKAAAILGPENVRRLVQAASRPTTPSAESAQLSVFRLCQDFTPRVRKSNALSKLGAVADIMLGQHPNPLP